MKKTFVGALAVVGLLLTGCSSGEASNEPVGPDYEAIIATWEEAGKLVRPCEVDANSKNCEFGVRDAYDKVDRTFKIFVDAGLNHEPGYTEAYDVGYSWAFYEHGCFDNQKSSDVIACLQRVPEESDALTAIVGIRKLRDASSS